MSEPDITRDEEDVEGHTSSLKRNAPENESDDRDQDCRRHRHKSELCSELQHKSSPFAIAPTRTVVSRGTRIQS